MKLKEDIKPISYIKTNAANVLKSINANHRPVIITQNGEAKGVILDTETYEDMRSALGLMKVVSQAEDNIADKKLIKHNLVFGKIEKKLKNGK
ncbi:MAG: type II toxin-antitoxin system Phd/YefM family antitoxin [Fibrobacteria bacterium]|nr:type II toxin-antitoxin system Phd/YefM family antitoxin [Fibrobacteria bacterium]